MVRVFGIIGVVIGILFLILTATGVLWHDEPARGYIVGAIVTVGGFFRFLRGTNQVR